MIPYNIYQKISPLECRSPLWRNYCKCEGKTQGKSIRLKSPIDNPRIKNPWYPSSSAGRTNTRRVIPVASGLGLYPSFVVERSSSIAAFGRLDLYLREHFVCSSSISLKPSIQICFSIVSGACFLIIKFSYLLVVPILCSVDDLVDRLSNTGGQLHVPWRDASSDANLSKTLVLQGMFGPSTSFCIWNFRTPAWVNNVIALHESCLGQLTWDLFTGRVHRGFLILMLLTGFFSLVNFPWVFPSHLQ